MLFPTLLSFSRALRLGSYDQTDLRLALDHEATQVLFFAMDYSKSETALNAMLWGNASLWHHAFCRVFPHLDFREISPKSVAYTSQCLDAYLAREGYTTRSTMRFANFQSDLTPSDLIDVLDPVLISFTESGPDFVEIALLRLIELLPRPLFRIPSLLRLFTSLRMLYSEAEEEGFEHGERWREILDQVESAMKAVNRRGWGKALCGLARQIASPKPNLSRLTRSWLQSGLRWEPQAAYPIINQVENRRLTMRNRLMILGILAGYEFGEWKSELDGLLKEAKLLLLTEDLVWFMDLLPEPRVDEIVANWKLRQLVKRYEIPLMEGDLLQGKMLSMRGSPFPYEIPEALAENSLLSSVFPFLHAAAMKIQRPSQVHGTHEALSRAILASLHLLIKGHYHLVRRRPRWSISPILLESTQGSSLQLTSQVVHLFMGSLLRFAFQLGLRLPFHFDEHTRLMVEAIHEGRDAAVRLPNRVINIIWEYDNGKRLSPPQKSRLIRFDLLDTGRHAHFPQLLRFLRGAIRKDL